VATYFSLLSVRDFPALVLASGLGVGAGVVGGLALATLVFAGTGSPLLAAVAMFGPAFGHLVGASLLLHLADRIPPRAGLATLALLMGAVLAVLAVPGLPVAAVVTLVLGSGVLASLNAAIRWGLVAEVLPAESYVLGRSVVQMTTGAVQVGGNAIAAGLLLLLEPATVLLLAAGLDAVAAAVLIAGLTSRAPRATGRAIRGATWAGNRRLWALPGVPATYLALWVPNGLVVGAEALFVPYAGPAAGLLFTAGALGMLAGDAVMGRFVPASWRPRLVTPTRLLLALPYLAFALAPAVPVAAVLVAVASAGFSAGLLLQERLLALTPTGDRGHALGLHSSGMLAGQGIAAVLAGALAELLGVRWAMTGVAIASVAVTIALIPALRQPVPAPARTRTP